jgi:uncharacterized protein (DUF433 family)
MQGEKISNVFQETAFNCTTFKYFLNSIRIMRVEISKHIVADSEICHGKPTFKGTRILVSDIVELVAAGETTEQLLEEYPGLSREMIQEALEYAAKLVRGEHYVTSSKVST